VLAQLGQAARATEASASALALNPTRPHWYFPAAAFTHPLARDLEASVRLGRSAPDALVDARALLASPCAHRGELAEARRHLARFIENFRERIRRGREPEAGEPVRWLQRVTPLRRSSDAEYVLDGLRRAGLELPASEG
jgi:hypothetical protein